MWPSGISQICPWCAPDTLAVAHRPGALWKLSSLIVPGLLTVEMSVCYGKAKPCSLCVLLSVGGEATAAGDTCCREDQGALRLVGKATPCCSFLGVWSVSAGQLPVDGLTKGSSVTWADGFCSFFTSVFVYFHWRSSSGASGLVCHRTTKGVPVCPAVVELKTKNNLLFFTSKTTERQKWGNMGFLKWLKLLSSS